MEGQGRVEKEGLNKESEGRGDGGVAEVEGWHGEGEREESQLQEMLGLKARLKIEPFFPQVCWYFFALFLLDLTI